MKKIILVLLVLINFLLLMSEMVFSEEAIVLSEVMKPSQLVVEADYIYVIEKTTIYIYSAKDYKFIKKFGKEGEGPKEFKVFVTITPYKDKLLINSLNKISFYTKDGNYIKEIKGKSGLLGGNIFLPLSNGYVGRGTSIKDKEVFSTFNFYDKTLNKIKEIAKIKVVGKGGKRELLKQLFLIQTYRDKIYLSTGSGFKINIMDREGKKLFSIEKNDYEKREFTAKDKKIMVDQLKKQFKQQYEAVKSFLSFPKYYPEILNFFIANEKLFVSTWKWKDNKIEFFIFDLTGKELKHIYIPFAFSSPLTPYPAAINNDKLYQLIENEDTEEWELHISDIN